MDKHSGQFDIYHQNILVAAQALGWRIAVGLVLAALVLRLSP